MRFIKSLFTPALAPFASAIALALVSLFACSQARADGNAAPAPVPAGVAISKADLRTSVSALLFLARNAGALTVVKDENCPFSSLDELLAFAGDDRDKGTTSSMNLKITRLRQGLDVTLSVSDDDGTTESGVSVHFGVDLTHDTVMRSEIRCLVAG